MRTAKILSVLLVVAMMLPLASCGGTGGAQKIRVGLIAPMTGDVKTFGDSTKAGAEMAAAEWNAKGGVNGKQIELVLGDDKNDPAEASNAATKLITQDKVKFIIGSVASKCSIPISELAEKNKVLQISPTSTNAKVTVDPWPGGTRKQYVFRACFIDDFQGPAMARFAVETLKAKKAAVLYDNGNDYVKGLAETFKGGFEKLGGTVTVFEAYSINDTDFSALLTKVLADVPDILYLPDYYNKVNLIAKQARDKGYTGVMAGGDGWDSSDLVVGPVEGCYFTNHYSAEDPRPESQNFVKAYKEKYGKDPDALATLAYDAANLLFNAMATAKSEDPTVVKDALQNTKGFKAVSGEVTFDENGNPLKDISMIMIKDGGYHFGGIAKP